MSCCEKKNQAIVESSPLSCCRPQQPSKLLKAVELISRLMLGAFAMLRSAFIFVLSASAGVLMGMGYAFYAIYGDGVVQQGEARPSCAQGFFDFLSGVRCSPVVSTIITAIFIAGHMKHSRFYVGFCGVPWGFYVGFQGIVRIEKMGHQFDKMLPT